MNNAVYLNPKLDFFGADCGSTEDIASANSTPVKSQDDEEGSPTPACSATLPCADAGAASTTRDADADAHAGANAKAGATAEVTARKPRFLGCDGWPSMWPFSSFSGEKEVVLTGWELE